MDAMSYSGPLLGTLPRHRLERADPAAGRSKDWIFEALDPELCSGWDSLVLKRAAGELPWQKCQPLRMLEVASSR